MDGQILISDQPVADLIHISQTLHYNLLKFQFVGWLLSLLPRFSNLTSSGTQSSLTSWESDSAIISEMKALRHSSDEGLCVYMTINMTKV